MNIARAVVALLLAVAPLVAQAAPTQAQLQKDRADTAAKLYRDSVGALQNGKGTTDTVYQWSVRWLESDYERATAAKPKKQALVDHAARMVELEAEAAKQVAAGTLRVSDRDAAMYFRIEADLWVLRGKPH